MFSKIVSDRGPLNALADLPYMRRHILRISNRIGVKFSQQLHRHDIKNENKLLQNFCHAGLMFCPHFEDESCPL
jgi:hypothetical protein